MSIKKGVIVQGFEWYLPEDSRHWKRLLGETEYWKQIGITAVWLPPAYKGAGGVSDVGYGVYDMYDLGEFNQKGTVPTKYGTKDEYLALVKALQQNGIDVYGDVVLNHRMGADECEPVAALEYSDDNRNAQTNGEKIIGSWDVFTFPGRGGKYSDFKWNSKQFDGIDWDQNNSQKGVYLFKDKQWDSDCDDEKGNYDYLMGADIDYSDASAVEEAANWGRWYLDMTDVNGLRLDALKHINSSFYKDWLGKMRQHCGKELFTVGEYWSREPNKLEKYLRSADFCMSLFDVPLHFNFRNASNCGGSFDMRNILKNSLLERLPLNTVTFVDNHDTQPGQALASYVEPWFRPLAYALILLRPEGYPCIFYGDLYGIPHDNIGDISSMLRLFLKLRQERVSEDIHNYFDDCNVVGWSFGGAEPMAVLMSDSEGGSKKMYVDKSLAGRTLTRIYGRSCDNSAVLIDSEGCGIFRVDGGDVVIWV